jgi:hypothetical protein
LRPQTARSLRVELGFHSKEFHMTSQQIKFAHRNHFFDDCTDEEERFVPVRVVSSESNMVVIQYAGEELPEVQEVSVEEELVFDEDPE